jgi:hypothetical protein
MNIKTMLKICVIFFAVSSNAQQLTALECVGETKVGASNSPNIHKNSLSKIDDTEILITVKEGVLTVEGMEFKEIETSYAKTEEDVFIAGYLKTKDISYEGFYTIKQWAADSKLYLYSNKVISLNRLNGEFYYSWVFHTQNIKDNWLGKLTKTNLNKGYLHRDVKGKCKKSDVKQLF